MVNFSNSYQLESLCENIHIFAHEDILLLPIANNNWGTKLNRYCSNNLKEYLEDKNEKKISEVSNIISGLLEAWEEIQK